MRSLATTSASRSAGSPLSWLATTAPIRFEGIRFGCADPRVYDATFEAGTFTSVRPSASGGERAPHVSTRHDGSSTVLSAPGHLVVPGYWDGHLHISAWLRARYSAPLGDEPEMSGWLSAARRSRANRAASSSAWLVGFGWDHHHDERYILRAVEETDEPCLIVHRTGHAALVNTAGARLFGLDGCGVVREIDGLWRRALGPLPPDWERSALRELRDTLVGQGVVRITDATPYPRAAAARIAHLRSQLLPLSVDFMAAPGEVRTDDTFVKYRASMAAPRSPSGPIALHATEPDEILGAIEKVKASRHAARIEHVALCPPAVARQLREIDATICMNPGFRVARPRMAELMAERGLDDYWHPVWSVWGGTPRIIVGSDAPVGNPGVAEAVMALSRRSEWPVDSRTDTLQLIVEDQPSLWGGAEHWAGRRGAFVVVPATALQSPTMFPQPVAVGFATGSVAVHASTNGVN